MLFPPIAKSPLMSATASYKFDSDDDPFDPNDRECVCGGFFENWRIVDRPTLGTFTDIPSIDEFTQYHPSARAARRIWDLDVERHWVVPRNDPSARPSLAFHWPPVLRDGFGDNCVIIAPRKLRRSSAYVRYILAEQAKRRKRRKPRLSARGPLKFPPIDTGR